MQEKQKHSVSASTSCSCQYSSLVDDHEGDNEFTICRVIRLLVCGVCVHALALLLCLRINPGAHLCLCVPFHACDFVFMYQSEPICIRALLPFKSLLHLSAYRMASGLQLCPGSWVTQPSSGFPPAISCSLSCMAHRWTTADAQHFIAAACREKQRRAGGWARGFKKTPVRMGYPVHRLAQLRPFICPSFKRH